MENLTVAQFYVGSRVGERLSEYEYSSLSWEDNTTSTAGPPSDAVAGLETWQTIILAIITSIISIVTIGGNLIVLLSFVIERTIRQPTNYFIASLAVSDLIIGAISMPIYSLYLLADKRWLLGETICDLWLSIDYTVCLCSIYTVFCITIDRFCSVRVPAKYRNWRTERKVAVIVSMTWTIPIFVFFTTIIGWQHFVGHRTVPEMQCFVQYMENPIFNCFLQVGYFWITLIVMCVLYSGIYRVALNLQQKSDAKQRKMTSLVSVAGHEISKIGIGMSQCPTAGGKTGRSGNRSRNQKEVNGESKDNGSFDVLSPDKCEETHCCRRHKGDRKDAAPHCLPCASSVSFSSNKTLGGVGDEDEASSSPTFASDSSQSPKDFEAFAKPQSFRKRRTIVPASHQAAKGDGNKCETSGASRAETVCNNYDEQTQPMTILGNMERLNDIGHLAAESVDSVVGPDEIRYDCRSSQIYDNTICDDTPISCFNSARNHSPKSFVLRLDASKEYGRCNRRMESDRGHENRCHRSAEILYSNDNDPCDYNFYNCRGKETSRRYDDKADSPCEDVFLQDHYDQTSNVYTISDADCAFTAIEPRTKILDGSEFLLRSHVDSGMKSRYSMGHLPNLNGKGNTTGDSPTSPIWKVRPDCAAKFAAFYSTSTSDIPCSDSNDFNRACSSKPMLQNNKPSKSAKTKFGKFITQGSNFFQFPSTNHSKDEQVPSSRQSNRSTNQNTNSCVMARGRCNSKEKSNVIRSCSDYEACPPDTAVTLINEDWQRTGPGFDLPIPPIPPRCGSVNRDTTGWRSLEFRRHKRSDRGSNSSSGNGISNSQRGPAKPRQSSGRRKRAASKTPKTGSSKSNRASNLTKQSSVDDQLEATSASERKRQQALKSSKSENRARKALRTISIILGAFVLCWTPWHVLSLVISIYPDVPLLNLFYDISYWLCYLNSPVNPFCYAFVNQQFKKTFIRILKCDWHRT